MIRFYFALRATKNRQKMGKLLWDKELKNLEKILRVWDFLCQTPACLIDFLIADYADYAGNLVEV